MIVEAARKFTSLAIAGQDRLLFGTCAHPLACGQGLTIGAGTVFPEVNFTLPPISITAGTWTQVTAPSPGAAGALDGVSCVSPFSCTAVGEFVGTALYAPPEPLVEQWDGGVWSQVAAASPGGSGALDGVSCVPFFSCTAVGEYTGTALYAPQEPLVETGGSAR